MTREEGIAVAFGNADRLTQLLNIDPPGEDIANVTGCVDPRVSLIEHVIHELAHAILLGAPIYFPLSTRIAMRFRDLSDGFDAEIEAFAVAENVLYRIGVAVELDGLLTRKLKNYEENIAAKKRGFAISAACSNTANQIMELLMRPLLIIASGEYPALADSPALKP